MPRLIMVLLLGTALLTSACSAAGQEVETGGAALQEVPPAPTPDDPRRPQPSELAPGVTPQPEWDTYAFPEPTSLDFDRLPDGRQVLCAPLEIEISDDVAPEQVDHRGYISRVRSETWWWVTIDNPVYERATGDDLALSPYLVPLSADDAVVYTAAGLDAKPPVFIRAHSIIGDGSQSLLAGVDQHGMLAAALVRAPDGDWAPIRRCGGYNPLFRLADAAAGSSAGVSDVYLQLLGHPDAAGVEVSIPVEELMVAMAPSAPQPEDVTDTWLAADPRQRVMDDAPPEVRDGFVPYVISVDVPETWYGDKSALLCSRTATGWNSCAALEALAELGPEEAKIVPLAGLRVVGEQVEIVLLNDQADLAGAMRVIGQVDPLLLDAKIDAHITIRASTGTESVLAGTSDVQLENES